MKINNRTGLPRGLNLHNGYWKISKMVDGKRTTVNIGSGKKMSREEAIRIFADIIERESDSLEKARNFYRCDGNDPYWTERINGFRNTANNWIKVIHQKAEARAAAKNLEFSITFLELKEIAISSMGRCQLTGITFTNDNPTGSRVAPFQASLDRIDSSKGYTKDNCRLICASVNLALMDFGDDVFRKIAFGYVAKFMENTSSAYFSASTGKASNG